VGHSARRERRENVRRLMAEAGASPALLQAQRVLAHTSRVLAFAGVALAVVGIVIGGKLLWIGLALAGSGFAAAAAIGWNALRVIDKVRWQDGTITIRTVEPGDVNEHGQRVVCEVELNPPARIARVATTVGPLDARQLVVGATMRCRIDRVEFSSVLHAFPYDASGRELAFRRV
jgi:hypothetical protein